MSRSYYDPAVDSVPLPEQFAFITVKDANIRARRSFFRAAVIFGVIGFAAGAVFAGDTANFNGTGCTLVPVSGQAHVAEVQCRNVNTSGPSPDQGVMEIEGMTVGLEVFHGPGDQLDLFIAMPPDGYLADPPILYLEEWTDGVVRIYPFVGA